MTELKYEHSFNSLVVVKGNCCLTLGMALKYIVGHDY